MTSRRTPSRRAVLTRNRVGVPFTVTVVATVLLATLLAACGAGSDSASPASGAADSPRVVALGLGDADTLLALGVTPVAVMPFNNEAVGVWSRKLLNGTTPTTLTSGSEDLSSRNLEEIAAARPTVISAANSDLSAEEVQKLSAIATVINRPAGTTAWQVPWQQLTTTIAAGVGLAPKGAELVTKTEAAIAQSAATRADLRGKTGAVVVPDDKGGLYVYSTKDARGQFLSDFGVTIPAALEQQMAGNFYLQLSAENIDQVNVDVLIYLASSGTDKTKTSANYTNLPAVRARHVAYLTKDEGDAMSLPNAISLPWTLERVVPKIPKL